MGILSLFKATVLGGVDVANDVLGGPSAFTRAAAPDPSGHFVDHLTRRDYIAEQAEAELAAFVRAGVFFAQKPNDLGDACIWQGVYTAMTALRWNLRPNQANHQAMLEAATALSRYFYPTGPGISILVRGAVPQALEREFFHVDPNNGSRYFTDGHLGETFVYREDASLDSLLGAMFGAAIVARFGDPAARAVLAPALARFSAGFQAAGYRLTNRDGSPTRHGNCAPGFFQAPVRTLAAALPGLLSGREDWRPIAQAHGPEFSRPDTQVPGKISYVNAHLGMLATLAYVCAAPSGAPGLEHARAGVRSLLGKYADAGNAFLVYAAARLGVAPTQRQKDQADRILLEFPLGSKPKSGHHARDGAALQPLPVWQRPPSDIAWQRNPYTFKGSESHDYTRLDYLIAHYLSRSA